MTHADAAKVGGATLAAILLVILNAMAMFSWTFSQPAIVSPFVSGGILAVVALFVIRWFRSGEPLNYTLSLSLIITFAPLIFALVCHPLASFGTMVWIIEAGLLYLPIAGILVALSWYRAVNWIQKGWLLLCGLIVVAGLLFNLWWHGTGQQITWP